jgi:membrane associated rhomboid family serine protease
MFHLAGQAGSGPLMSNVRPQKKPMYIAFLSLLVIGILLVALGVATMLSGTARSLLFGPSPVIGVIALVLGTSFTVTGLLGLHFVRRQLERERLNLEPSSVRLAPVRWVTLIMATMLAAYGLIGLLPESFALLANPKL